MMKEDILNHASGSNTPSSLPRDEKSEGVDLERGEHPELKNARPDKDEHDPYLVCLRLTFQEGSVGNNRAGNMDRSQRPRRPQELVV